MARRIRKTPSGPTERLRVPQPLIKNRLWSGRGAMEQPNATHDGDAALTPRFWLVLIGTGIATGLLAIGLMALLFWVQRTAFGYNTGTFQAGVQQATPGRRVLSLVLAGAFGGGAWYLLKRYTKGESSEIDDVLWSGVAELSWRRSLGSSIISEVVTGMGASLGRESAPKLMGGASATVLANALGMSPAQRRLLIACGGGAGFAAVYNVPLAGALFTAEVLCGSISLPTVLPALACSTIATLTGWIYLPSRAYYRDIPTYHVTATMIVWALVAGPVIGLLATIYVRFIGTLSGRRMSGLRALTAPLVAFTALGLIGIAYPQLFGNGKDIAHDAFVGHGTFALLAALFVLKPLVTAMCLGSGASGGLVTPVLCTGALFGAGFGTAWSQLWPGEPAGAYAMIGAAAMVGAAMQAPLSAVLLVLELTHTGFELMVPMIIATVVATTLTRYVDGYSIYTARLPAR